MKEILFKAKRIDNGEWVEGFVFFNGATENWCIIANYNKNDIYVVIANTICQYTGLTDKNVNKIWENDIVKDCSDNKRGAVKYLHGCFGAMTNPETGSGVYLHYINHKAEVIGNIFDNADLVKE